jgi:hypothetical protein
MVRFPPIVMLVFVLYSRWSFRSTKGFYSPQKVYGEQLVFFSKKVFMCLLCAPFSPLMERFFDHSFSLMSNFRESR